MYIVVRAGRLNAYFEKWDLKLELNKLQVMVMRKGTWGRKIKDSKKWVFNGEATMLVKAYSYMFGRMQVHR